MSLEFCNGGSAKKASVMLQPDGGKKSLTICAFLDIQYHNVTDGRIDGQTDRIAKNNIAL